MPDLVCPLFMGDTGSKRFFFPTAFVLVNLYTHVSLCACVYVNIFVFLMYLCVYSIVYAGVIYPGICSLKYMVVSFDFLIKNFIMANC